METTYTLDGYTLWIGDGDFGATVSGFTRPGHKRRIEGRRTGGRQAPMGVRLGFDEPKGTIKVKGVSPALREAVQSGEIDGVSLFIRAHLDDQQGGYTSFVEEWQGRCVDPEGFLSEVGDGETEGELEFWLTYVKTTEGGTVVRENDYYNNTFYPDETEQSSARQSSLGRN